MSKFISQQKLEEFKNVKKLEEDLDKAIRVSYYVMNNGWEDIKTKIYNVDISNKKIGDEALVKLNKVSWFSNINLITLIKLMEVV